MPAGILIGIAVIAFAVQQSLLPAFGLLLLLGVFGGFFIVPLNALLQERGKHSVGAGNAIAVQNLGENVAMLLMLGLYSPGGERGRSTGRRGDRLWRGIRRGHCRAVGLGAA